MSENTMDAEVGSANSAASVFLCLEFTEGNTLTFRYQPQGWLARCHAVSKPKRDWPCTRSGNEFASVHGLRLAHGVGASPPPAFATLATCGLLPAP